MMKYMCVQFLYFNYFATGDKSWIIFSLEHKKYPTEVYILFLTRFSCAIFPTEWRRHDSCRSHTYWFIPCGMSRVRCRVLRNDQMTLLGFFHEALKYRFIPLAKIVQSYGKIWHHPIKIASSNDNLVVLSLHCDYEYILLWCTSKKILVFPSTREHFSDTPPDNDIHHGA